jgi:hypothetical protein
MFSRVLFGLVDTLQGIVEARGRREEALRVTVPGSTQDGERVTGLHQLAALENEHSLGDGCDHPQIVSDEKQGKPEFSAQLTEQLEHRRLDRDVEGGGDLIADDQLRLGRQRSGDPDSLAFTA